MKFSWFWAAGILTVLSCQNLWEINPLQPFSNPPLPASGDMAGWEIDEFRSRMKSLTWVSAVINDSTLGAELTSRLTTLAGPSSTKVEASLLLIRAYSRVEGVPETTNRVITNMFPELISSGLLNGFNPATDAPALHSLVNSLFGQTGDSARTKIIQALVEVHQISASNLSVTAPGIDWYGGATLEELGQVAQLATGAGLIYAMYSTTLPANSIAKLLAFLNSAGTAVDLATNFIPINLGNALQALFDAMDKNTDNTDPLYEHLERIGDLLPF